MSAQAPPAVVMIRPHSFAPNLQTAADNVFQSSDERTPQQIACAAAAEFDTVVQQLQSAGVTVHVFDQQADQDTPDCVFPNNWFSTHAGGHIAVYPMYADNRKRERRWDIIEMLKRTYRVQDVIDYSGLETDGLALEGTGAMVLDHVARVAYTAQSNRADPVILERFCTHFNFEPMVFRAEDLSGSAIYHTNVMMSVGSRFALVCLDMIADSDRRDEVARRLEESGRQVIALSHHQVSDFAGNALELTGRDGPVLALSARAERSLDAEQKACIEQSAALLPIAIPTLEMAGGSVRCMLAGIHLSHR